MGVVLLLNLAIQGSGAETATDVNVFSIHGKQMIRIQNQSSFDTHTWPCGVYRVRVKGEHTVWMGSFMKE